MQAEETFETLVRLLSDTAKMGRSHKNWMMPNEWSRDYAIMVKVGLNK